MADKGVGKISGIKRAAILLMSLGQESASQVLKHMDPKEVQAIGSAMAETTQVSKDDVATVLAAFAETVDKQTGLGLGNDDYIKSVLVNALGEDKAGGMIDRILRGANSKGLETLKWLEPRAIAEIIRLEHPQIIR